MVGPSPGAAGHEYTHVDVAAAHPTSERYLLALCFPHLADSRSTQFCLNPHLCNLFHVTVSRFADFPEAGISAPGKVRVCQGYGCPSWQAIERLGGLQKGRYFSDREERITKYSDSEHGKVEQSVTKGICLHADSDW